MRPILIINNKFMGIGNPFGGMGKKSEIPPLADGQIVVDVQRHDEHKFGHLTPEGKEHARAIAQEKIRKYLDNNPKTHFMIIASDQILDEREPGFGGIRAKETANEIVQVVKEELEVRGLPSDQLFGHDDTPISMSPNLREAGIFANDFMKFLRESNPDSKPGKIWEMYYQDIYEDKREEMHAESPDDLAKRMDYEFKVGEMVGAAFFRDENNKDCPLTIIFVGHGGGIDKWLHKYAGVPIENLGFPTSGGFLLRARKEDGKLVVEVKGKEYIVNEDPDMSLPENKLEIKKNTNNFGEDVSFDPSDPSSQKRTEEQMKKRFREGL